MCRSNLTVSPLSTTLVTGSVVFCTAGAVHRTLHHAERRIPIHPLPARFVGPEKSAIGIRESALWDLRLSIVRGSEQTRGGPAIDPFSALLIRPRVRVVPIFNGAFRNRNGLHPAGRRNSAGLFLCRGRTQPVLASRIIVAIALFIRSLLLLCRQPPAYRAERTAGNRFSVAVDHGSGRRAVARITCPLRLPGCADFHPDRRTSGRNVVGLRCILLLIWLQLYLR